LSRETLIVDALKLDSLRLLTLVVEIENHFRVALEDGSEAGIETVGDLIDAIRRGLDSDGADTH
jgi:acyl carrier protein